MAADNPPSGITPRALVIFFCLWLFLWFLVLELEGLKEAMNQYSVPLGTIITMNQEEEITITEGIIRITPVWRWILDNS